MILTAVKTRKVLPGALTLTDLLDESLGVLQERSIVVVTSKVVSICEGNVLPVEGADRDELVRSEAELYFGHESPEGHRYSFTIKQNTLIPASGIDESNGNGYYILWPKDSMASASAIRAHLMKRDGLTELGVLITDSTIGLSRWGTLGIAIAHCGFDPVKNYIGQPDIFGRTLTLSKANVAGGLAAAAVMVMGEGAEQTPLAVIEDVPSVHFWRGPKAKGNQGMYYVSPVDDEPFRPFFAGIDWKPGGQFHG